jgi:hypothetical protein
VVQDANLINAGQVLNDVANLKAHYIVETYVNGTSWYRVYSDGWCEQGGFSAGDNWRTVTFLKPFTDTQYSIQLTCCANGRDGDSGTVQVNSSNKTTSTMYISAWGATISGEGIYWECKGYIN